jgi:hypothetical protein
MDSSNRNTAPNQRSSLCWERFAARPIGPLDMRALGSRHLHARSTCQIPPLPLRIRRSTQRTKAQGRGLRAGPRIVRRVASRTVSRRLNTRWFRLPDASCWPSDDSRAANLRNSLTAAVALSLLRDAAIRAEQVARIAARIALHSLCLALIHACTLGVRIERMGGKRANRSSLAATRGVRNHRCICPRNESGTRRVSRYPHLPGCGSRTRANTGQQHQERRDYGIFRHNRIPLVVTRNADSCPVTATRRTRMRHRSLAT